MLRTSVPTRLVLTENRMTVVRGIFANVRDNVCKKPLKISPAAMDIILEGFACCSTAKILPPPPPKDDETTYDARPLLIGSKTEAAMLLLAQSEWGSKDDTDKRRNAANFGKEGGSRLFPFSSKRKRMTVLVNKGETNWTMYHKGAAELILENCTMYSDIDGNEQPMTAEKREFFEGVIQEFAEDALRCIAICHRKNVHKVVKNISDITLSQCEQKLEKEMCLDAMVGIADPLRSDVVDAVATCQRAGIFVRMVTGDNLETARAIAKQAGILTKGESNGSWLFCFVVFARRDHSDKFWHERTLRWPVHNRGGVSKANTRTVGRNSPQAPSPCSF
jgi:P-type Ca2+ transporter type 2C